jgi:hypothetical protein
LELLKELPPIGSTVVTEDGRARVIHHQILGQQLLVQTEDNRRLLIHLSDVRSESENTDDEPSSE